MWRVNTTIWVKKGCGENFRTHVFVLVDGNTGGTPRNSLLGQESGENWLRTRRE